MPVRKIPAASPFRIECVMPEEKEQRTFRMGICFDGTAYHGWQRQSNGITVQQVIEERLFKLFGNTPIRIQGSSRTDAGVHALGLVASFQAPESPYIPDWKIHKAMNRLLPEDIRITGVEKVPDSFNARFSARGKSYVYVINNGSLSPFTDRWSWHLSDFNNLPAVSEALRYLQGRHDFSTFAVEAGKVDDPVRTIMRAEIYEKGPLKCIHFIGDGFLYKMVRSMTGALAEVGRNRLPPHAVGDMLEARNRSAARDTAPARGLFLMKVFYSPDEWLDYTADGVPFRG